MVRHDQCFAHVCEQPRALDNQDLWVSHEVRVVPPVQDPS
jgi:hypothetical protein